MRGLGYSDTWPLWRYQGLVCILIIDYLVALDYMWRLMKTNLHMLEYWIQHSKSSVINLPC